ncbi:MAG: hypothetical protein M5U28_45960 [Sandaracinaceae bacterium]|nr:hypothetical protein [Sandaracinaceae bacterium]
MVSTREVTAKTRTERPSEDPPRGSSETLAAAPSPFDDSEDVSIAGLPRVAAKKPKTEREGKGSWKTVAIAFALGVGIVAAGFGVHRWLAEGSAEPALDLAALADEARDALGRGRLDEPREGSVLGITDRILAQQPEHPEALQPAARGGRSAGPPRRAGGRARRPRRGALALPARAGLPRRRGHRGGPRGARRAARPDHAAGVRTRPVAVVERAEVVLSATLEPGVEPAPGARPRFVIRRGARQIGQPVEATATEDGRTYEAPYTFADAGTHRVLFQLGTGDDRVEMAVDVEVQRDAARPPRRGTPDPPPVTTQGSTWTPPTIAPAWMPTPVPTTQAPPPPPPEPDPPPPPAPWTGGGSVL